MVRHIVMWKFRPGTEAEQQRFLDGLRGLQGVIPEMLKSEVVIGIGGDYDAGLVSEFRSMGELQRYKDDPRHLAVAAICKAIRTDRASLDYEF